MSLNLRALFRRNTDADTAHALYTATVIAARDPGFFMAWGVPDTVEGRFEVLCIRAFVLLRRLKGEPEAAALSQAYFDLMFDDLDANLRELGVGDMSVGKKIKKLAGGFYGRIKAYDTAVDETDTDEQLANALQRFVFRDVAVAPETLKTAVDFVRADVAALAAQPLDRLKTGDVQFKEFTA